MCVIVIMIECSFFDIKVQREEGEISEMVNAIDIKSAHTVHCHSKEQLSCVVLHEKSAS